MVASVSSERISWETTTAVRRLLARRGVCEVMLFQVTMMVAPNEEGYSDKGAIESSDRG